MEIQIVRLSNKNNSIPGLLLVNGIFECYTLEKVSTAIEEGIYFLGFQQVLTSKTKKYRKRFKWFTHHVEVKNVIGRTGIYIHIGNYIKDTRGCILLGDSQSFSKKAESTVQNSTIAYERFYKTVVPLIDETTTIRITNLQDYAKKSRPFKD